MWERQEEACLPDWETQSEMVGTDSQLSPPCDCEDSVDSEQRSRTPATKRLWLAWHQLSCCAFKLGKTEIGQLPGGLGCRRALRFFQGIWPSKNPLDSWGVG